MLGLRRSGLRQALLCQYRFGHWKLKHEAKTCATIAWGHIKVSVIPSHTCKHLQILGCGRARFWQTIYEDILPWPVSCPHLAFTALFPAFRLEANSCLSFGLCGVMKHYYVILTFATKGRAPTALSISRVIGDAHARAFKIKCLRFEIDHD